MEANMPAADLRSDETKYFDSEIARAVLRERERCAKIAEDRWRRWRCSLPRDLDGMDACADIAKAIRE
jgi:hypothetical protein